MSVDPRLPWVLTYDVVNDRRRARLARFLEAHGHRVQWSVFEMLATPDELEAIVARALTGERFNPAEDSLRVYPLCAGCMGRVGVHGVAAPLLTPGRAVVL